MGRYKQVHVAHGVSAAASLLELLGPAPDMLVVSFPDSLSCGRLAPIADFSSWREERLRFWNEVCAAPDDGEEQDESCPIWGFEVRDLIRQPEFLEEADEVVLWVGETLPEQLMLAVIPHVMSAVSADVQKLRVIDVRGVETRGRVAHVGTMRAEELAACPPARRPDAAELASMDEAWATAVSNDPDALLAYLGRQKHASERLAPNLDELLSFYPSVTSGVNLFEELLLRSVRDHAPRVARVIGHALGAIDVRGHDIGDLWLFHRLRRLADPRLVRPAVDMKGTRTEMRSTEVSITGAGLRILGHELNFVDVNGIDDWIGGVHLDSEAGHVWLREGDTLVRAS